MRRAGRLAVRTSRLQRGDRRFESVPAHGRFGVVPIRPQLHYPHPISRAATPSNRGHIRTRLSSLGRRMVDRVYRTDLPELRKNLLNLRKEFSTLDTSTDWVLLRVDPLIAHVDRLQAMVRIWDSSRLRGAVPLLHADLVYFRSNVRGLRRLLSSEERMSRKKRGAGRSSRP